MRNKDDPGSEDSFSDELFVSLMDDTVVTDELVAGDGEGGELDG